MLQDVIERLFARFVGVVSANRQNVLSGLEVKTLADGRILTADEALDAKLIDQVAYLDEAVEVMKKELAIDRARVITIPGQVTSNRTFTQTCRCPDLRP